MSKVLESFNTEIEREPAASFDELAKQFGYAEEESAPTDPITFAPEVVSKVQNPKAPKKESLSLTEEVGKGAVQAGVKLTQSFLNGVVNVADSVENYAAELGLGSGDLINDNAKIDWSKYTGSPSDAPATRITQGIVQYAAPVAATMAAGGGVLAGLAAGVAVDALVYDPNEDRLSDLILNLAPEIRNVAVS